MLPVLRLHPDKGPKARSVTTVFVSIFLVISVLASGFVFHFILFNEICYTWNHASMRFLVVNLLFVLVFVLITSHPVLSATTQKQQFLILYSMYLPNCGEITRPLIVRYEVYNQSYKVLITK